MKVKIIDILNRIAEGKNIPIKIKINDEVYIYDIALSNSLNDEVEILDNETNEIEELTEIEYHEINGVGDEHDQYVLSDNQKYICEAYDDVELVVIRKINELVRAVNKIQKEQVLTKSLNIISDCAKETNCMSD